MALAFYLKRSPLQIFSGSFQVTVSNTEVSPTLWLLPLCRLPGQFTSTFKNFLYVSQYSLIIDCIAHLARKIVMGILAWLFDWFFGCHQYTQQLGEIQTFVKNGLRLQQIHAWIQEIKLFLDQRFHLIFGIFHEQLIQLCNVQYQKCLQSFSWALGLLSNTM